MINGIPESFFWSAEFSSLLTVAENKTAYDGWAAYQKDKALEEARKK